MVDLFLVTCEHGGCNIPARYRQFFEDCTPLLASHRGYDPGALIMARALASAFSAPLVYSTTSRLLVDLNRSQGHPRLHAAQIRLAKPALRTEIIENHYRPYRDRVEQIVGNAIHDGHRVVHISSHSFTPSFYGKTRRADIGLLYDPTREGELWLSERWKNALEAVEPRLAVRRNYPYAGKGDGLTRTLRSVHPPSRYIGIELELNQRHTLRPVAEWRHLRHAVVEALKAATKPPLARRLQPRLRPSRR